jgi:Flp pilus assembly protein TadG
MTKLTLVGDNSGQSIIEMALLAPLLILLLLGAAEYGRLYYIGIEVTNAAHAGVEYGTQNPNYAALGNNANIQLAAFNDELDLVNKNVNALGVLTPLTTSSITVQQLCASLYSDDPFHTPPCSTTSPNPIQYVYVQTQVTVASLYSVYGFPRTHTLHGSAIMRVRE